MERINKIMEAFFKNLPPEKVKELKVLKTFDRLIPKRYREMISLKEVKDGVIFLEVSSPVLRNDIEFMKSELIKKINQEIKENFIIDVKIQGV